MNKKRDIKKCKGCKHFCTSTKSHWIKVIMTLGIVRPLYGCTNVPHYCPGCGPKVFNKKNYEKEYCLKQGEI